MMSFGLESNPYLATLMNEHLTRRQRGVRLAEVRVTHVQHAKRAIGDARRLRLNVGAGRTRSPTRLVSQGRPGGGSR